MRGLGPRRAFPHGGGALRAGFVAAALLLAIPLPALAQERRLLHAPPDSLRAGTAWECVVSVARASDWDGIDLFFRDARSRGFALLPMTEARGVFRATIPGDRIAPPVLEYYLSARLASGSVATLPPSLPEERPLRVRVWAATEGVLVLAPSEGEVTASDRPEIAALFDPPIGDPSDAILLLDGVDRSAECERSPDYVLLVPQTPLAAGVHEVTVVAFPDSGGPRARSWRFSVAGSASGPGAPAPSEVAPSATPSPAEHGRTTSGRWEAGWAVVDAAGSPDPLVLPYREISRFAFDGSFETASRGGVNAFRAEASRHPVYDDAVRGSARLDLGRIRLEGGDVYPYFSDLSIAWQSGKGGLAQIDARRVTITALGLRTLGAEVSDGFGSYAEYLWGAAAALRVGENRAAVHLAYAYDREASIPESARFTDPRANQVATLLFGRRLVPWIDLAVEVAACRTTEEAFQSGLDAADGGDGVSANGAFGDDDERAAAVRGVATLGAAGRAQLVLEYHDYGRGFSSFGSPTVDSGERGVVVDASGRLPAGFRGSSRAEIYTDRDIYTPLRDGTPIVQVTARIERESRGPRGTLSAYLLGRLYRVPYEDVPYRDRYATLGAYAQRGRAALSTSVTRSRTESASVVPDGTAACVEDQATAGGSEDEWTVSGTASATGLRRRVSTRLGLRWTGSDPALGCHRDRWTGSAEASVLIRGKTVSIEYQRIEERAEGSADGEFVEHLITAALGGAF